MSTWLKASLTLLKASLTMLKTVDDVVVDVAQLLMASLTFPGEERSEDGNSSS